MTDKTATRPTAHILRPHHVALLAVLMLAFREYESKLPGPFILHIYRVLLTEISEIAEPRSYHEFLQELSNGLKAEAEEPQRLLTNFKNFHNELQTLDQMSDFFHKIPVLFVEKGEEDETSEPPIFSRRSLFGFFCRRCFVTFLKLSFTGTLKLHHNYHLWCNGDNQAGYEPIVKDQWNNGDLWTFRTSADKKASPQTEAYAAWEKGQMTGDANVAGENLRRFFEQRFHESNDSGYRQHALLGLVRMHYVRGEIVAARKLLREAITVARTNGDKVTLQHCISLLHRLPPTDPHKRPSINEIQPEIHPLEILFDVWKLMHIPHKQPMSASFEKIIQAVGVYDHCSDHRPVRLRKPIGPEEEAGGDQWAFHAVQAVVWAAVGCDQVAAVEESVVTAFTEIGGDDNNRVTVTLNRAYKLARQGGYTQALSVLLSPDVWRGLSSHSYGMWANQIWHILVLRASRRGQKRLFLEYLKPRRPSGPYNPRDYWFEAPGGSENLILDPLFEVVQFRQWDEGAAAINQLLTALWHSEFLGRLGLYRIAIILLADVGLGFGMTTRSRKLLEEIMPQVVNGDDLEQRALACFTLARCTIASINHGQGAIPNVEQMTTEIALREALRLLEQSEKDYRSLQLLRPLIDVQYLISTVYHNLGMWNEREEAATRHFRTQEEATEFEGVIVDEEVKNVWQVVMDVGAALAAR